MMMPGGSVEAGNSLSPANAPATSVVVASESTSSPPSPSTSSPVEIAQLSPVPPILPLEESLHLPCTTSISTLATDSTSATSMASEGTYPNNSIALEELSYESSRLTIDADLTGNLEMNRQPLFNNTAALATGGTSTSASGHATPLSAPASVRSDNSDYDHGGPDGLPSSQQSTASPNGGNGLLNTARHEKSLGLLTTRFVTLLQESKNGVLDLKQVRMSSLLITISFQLLKCSFLI